MRLILAASRRFKPLAGPYGAAVGLSLLLATSKPALAEFEVQESTIDPGEIQVQYRGAWHHGLPGTSLDEAVLPDDEEAPLRQSHELELQMSVTDHWLLALTHGFDQPDEEDLSLTSIEFETQIELVTLKGDGIGFSLQGGVEEAVFEAAETNASDLHFGPIVEAAQSGFVLTLNPMFFKERGDISTQEGFGFEYGSQLRYAVNKRLSLAVEMFGEIEDMAQAGSFNDQEHSVGPAFYYTFGADDDDEDEIDPVTKKHGPTDAELTVSLGGQFGLTDQTSDFAVKVFIGYEYK